MNRRLHIEIG